MRRNTTEDVNGPEMGLEPNQKGFLSQGSSLLSSIRNPFKGAIFGVEVHGQSAGQGVNGILVGITYFGLICKVPL